MSESELREAIDVLKRQRDFFEQDSKRQHAWVHRLEDSVALLRGALEEIAGLPRPQLQGDRTWRVIAQEALASQGANSHPLPESRATKREDVTASGEKG